MKSSLIHWENNPHKKIKPAQKSDFVFFFNQKKESIPSFLLVFWQDHSLQ